MSSKVCFFLAPTPRRRHRRSSLAFSLVEVLVALVLMALLLAAIGQITVQAVSAEHTSSAEAKSQARAARPFEILAADWQQRLRVEGAVAAQLNANHQPELTLLCLAPDGSTHSNLRMMPQRVTYRAEREEYSDRLRWLRSVLPLASHDPERQETLVCNLTEVVVDVFVTDGWQPLAGECEWSADCSALRITCAWSNGQRQERTFELDSPKRSIRRRVR